MTQFITVIAYQCSPEGIVIQNIQPTQFTINADLIACINTENQVQLKNVNVMCTFGLNYTGFYLPGGAQMRKLIGQ